MRRWLLLTVLLVLTAGTWAAAWWALQLTRSIAGELDRARHLAELAPRPQATVVFDRHGEPAFTYFVQQRMDVPLAAVSPVMVHALLAVEDRRFYAHRGLDAIRIAAAAWRNLRAGRIREGASTITQQLARVSRLSPVRTYERKLREMLLAIHLEQRYGKDRILEEYLNTVYFGEGLYGIEAAARGYFGVAARELDAAQAALLAAIVRSPSRYSPRTSPASALARRNLVLRLMHDQGRIDRPTFDEAASGPLPPVLTGADTPVFVRATGAGLYFQEELRRQLVGRFGEERVLRGGLRVHSTYDPRLQAEAERAVMGRIAAIARKRPGAAALQGSLVALDPRSGDVLALVGGRDFLESRFNRATQARRQAGSAFKPIVFAAALDRGYAPGSILRNLDAPIPTAEGGWLPRDGHLEPEYTLRHALQVSSNRAAAQLLQEIGLTTTIHYAQRLGITSPLPLVPSLALGSGEVTLLELTAAYTAFANHGAAAAPRLFTRVEDVSGRVLHEVGARHTQALSASTAFLISSMLADVVSAGTGAAARRAGFRLPAAGKTGTTNDYADAWFIGYTPRIVTGVWFGLDRPAAIMRGGFAGVVAVPAWASFMTAATGGDPPEWYDVPPDVRRVAVCRLSGARATDACAYRYTYAPAVHQEGDARAAVDGPMVHEDFFVRGNEPRHTCELHVAPPVQTTLTDRVLQRTTTAVVSPTGVATTYVIERVRGADGTLRTVVRQGREP